MTPFKISKKELTEEPLGEQLKKARIKKGVGFEGIEEAVRIRVKYLKAIEQENWAVFPSQAHLKGFLKSYCQYLEIPWQAILSQYKRGQGIENGLKKKLLPPRKEIRFPRIYITPALLLLVFFSIIVLGVIIYIGYQISGFAAAPYLLIKSPNYGATVSENSVVVEGKTSRGATLYLNGQLVPIGSDGEFKQEVKLKEGSNSISFSALNRAGKKSEKVLIIIYQPQ